MIKGERGQLVRASGQDERARPEVETAVLFDEIAARREDRWSAPGRSSSRMAVANSANVTPRWLNDTVSRISTTRSTVRCGRAGVRPTLASSVDDSGQGLATSREATYSFGNIRISGSLSVNTYPPKGPHHVRTRLSRHVPHQQRRPAAVGRFTAGRPADRQHRPDSAAQGRYGPRHPHQAAAPGPRKGTGGPHGHHGARLPPAHPLPHRYRRGVHLLRLLEVRRVPRPAADRGRLPV